jgi:methylglutaconyl-CoA hydratase
VSLGVPYSSNVILANMLNEEILGPILRLTIDRPEVKNAFNAELIKRLTLAFQDLPANIRAVVITGSGSVFCAGGDLEWMRQAANFSIEQNEADALKLAQLYQSIVDCPAVVIALVNGPCYGGGCGIVAAADVAIAVENATFAFSEVRLGLVPATISPFVIEKIGPGHARHLFSTGQVFDANHALRIGLVHQVGSAEVSKEHMRKCLQAVLAAGPSAVSRAKMLAAEPPLTLHATAALLAETRANEEAQEGIAAFLEKRKPSFFASLNQTVTDQ